MKSSFHMFFFFFLPHRQIRDGNVEPLGLLDTAQPPLHLQTGCTPLVASSSDKTQVVMSQPDTDKPRPKAKSPPCVKMVWGTLGNPGMVY